MKSTGSIWENLTIQMGLKGLKTELLPFKNITLKFFFLFRYYILQPALHQRRNRNRKRKKKEILFSCACHTLGISFASEIFQCEATKRKRNPSARQTQEKQNFSFSCACVPTLLASLRRQYEAGFFFRFPTFQRLKFQSSGFGILFPNTFRPSRALFT